MMKPDEPFDPIAAQLKKAGEQKRQREAASKGEQLLAVGFAEQARATAPVELARVEAILKERGAAINASNVPKLPRLAFVKSAPSGTVSNSRLDAGKFSLLRAPVLESASLDRQQTAGRAHRVPAMYERLPEL